MRLHRHLAVLLVASSAAIAGEPLADGEVCTQNSACESHYCYPGPDNQRYCLAADRNCAFPGQRGAQYGESYYYQGKVWGCFAATSSSPAGVRTDTTLPCGLTTAQLAKIHDIWQNRKVSGDTYKGRYTAWLGPNFVGSSSLYTIQVLTSNLLQMAAYCGDVSLLDDLASVYVNAADHARPLADGVSKAWLQPDQGGVESFLNSSQFVHATAYLARHAAARSRDFGATGSIAPLMERLVPIARDMLLRWIRAPSAVTWSNCPVGGDPRGIGPYSFSEYAGLKLSRAFGVAGSPAYCNTVTEPEMWMATAATELLALNASSPALLPLDAQAIVDLRDYARKAMKLFESRLQLGLSTSPRCGGACHIQLFDPDGWKGHLPDYPNEYWGDRNVTTAWDLSHGRRMVNFLETLYGSPAFTAPSLDGTLVKTRFSNAIVYSVWNGDTSTPLPVFHNFLNGNAVPYPQNPTRNIIFDEYEFSSAFMTGGYAFWGPVNSDLRRLNNATAAALARLEAVELSGKSSLDAMSWPDAYRLPDLPAYNPYNPAARNPSLAGYEFWELYMLFLASLSHAP